MWKAEGLLWSSELSLLSQCRTCSQRALTVCPLEVHNSGHTRKELAGLGASSCALKKVERRLLSAHCLVEKRLLLHYCFREGSLDFPVIYNNLVVQRLHHAGKACLSFSIQSPVSVFHPHIALGESFN